MRRARAGCWNGYSALALAVADVPVSAYTEIGTIIRKYADRKIDFADAALVWLANHTGMRDILTVDAAYATVSEGRIANSPA